MWAVPQDFPRRVTLVVTDFRFILPQVYKEQESLGTTDHAYRYEPRLNQFVLESYSEQYQVAKMVCEERVTEDGCRYTVYRPVYETRTREVLVRPPSALPRVLTHVPVILQPPCSCESRGPPW